MLIRDHNVWVIEDNLLLHNLFGDKIILNYLKIDATHLYDYDLLLKLEIQKKIACPGIWLIKKNIDLMSLTQRIHFLLDIFQMSTIVFVSVINHYYINGLHLLWDTYIIPRINLFGIWMEYIQTMYFKLRPQGNRFWHT